MERNNDASCHPDVLRFWEMLADGVEAGQPMISVIRMIEKALPLEPMGRVAAKLGDDLNKSYTLSEAMSKQPGAFSRAHLCLVEGGERVGRVDRLLRLIAEFTRDCPSCGNLQILRSRTQ
jgi:type II secretory pathway component PulF